jgi:hypothetical protein
MEFSPKPWPAGLPLEPRTLSPEQITALFTTINQLITSVRETKAQLEEFLRKCQEAVNKGNDEERIAFVRENRLEDWVWSAWQNEDQFWFSFGFLDPRRLSEQPKCAER